MLERNNNVIISIHIRKKNLLIQKYTSEIRIAIWKKKSNKNKNSKFYKVLLIEILIQNLLFFFIIFNANIFKV